jgi:hypothetical protein
VITGYDFPESEDEVRVLNLRALWRTKSYIVKFNAGEEGSGEMPGIVVQADGISTLPKCQFSPP